MKFKITQKCYWSEKGRKPELYYPGDIYQSSTLNPKDAPIFVVPVVNEPIKVIAPVKSNASAPEELSYHAMKTFVSDNNIKVANYQKETMIEAIAAFKAGDKPTEDDTSEEVLEVPED